MSRRKDRRQRQRGFGTPVSYEQAFGAPPPVRPEGTINGSGTLDSGGTRLGIKIGYALWAVLIVIVAMHSFAAAIVLGLITLVLFIRNSRQHFGRVRAVNSHHSRMKAWQQANPLGQQ